MLNLEVAICEWDQGYVHKLASYLLTYNIHHFSVHVLSTESNLLKFLKNNPIDILLISEKLYIKMTKKPLIEVTILLVDHLISTSLLQMPKINKYQQGHLIVDEIVAYYTSLCSKELVSATANTTTELICVYSPIGGSGKTTISLALANTLALQGYKTLFLSLEEIPSYSKMLEMNFSSSMSDLLYHISKRTENLLMKLEGIKKTDRITGMSYIPPPIYKEDMIGVAEEDWIYLMDYLLNAKEYQYIIIDFTSEYSKRNDLLMEKCHKKLIITNYNFASNEKLEALFKRGGRIEFNDENIIMVRNAAKPIKEVEMNKQEDKLVVCEIPYIEKLLVQKDDRITIDLDNGFGEGIRKLGKVISMDG
ncbi:MAG: hypothetical protein CVV02_06575 [Firmicutes bacterium HGW-Firmicutes-7]|nr:MAG: hypothetical protein CVV02_06575 [Firmicutes bacterium HGW-Firmicutes-7]